MQDHREIEQKVVQIIAEQLDKDPSQIRMESRFIEDLGADSLDVMQIVMNLEEAFGVQISEEDTEKIRTVGDAVQFIAQYVSRSTSA
jgi:acyl carrier protein